MNNTKSEQLLEWFSSEYQYKNTKEKTLTKLAESKALDNFHFAAKEVPAYKDFLKQHKINPTSIKSIDDFNQVPATTKENYIKKYPLHQLVPGGEISSQHFISTSSGTSGSPHFWPRNTQVEIEGAQAHEFILRDICKLATSKTLFINGFAMGNWIAGTFTASCMNLVSQKGYPVTVITPGYSTEAIIEVLKTLPEYYEHIIISGHTPFLKELVEEVINHGIDWKNIPTTLLGTGQAITENWRDYVCSLLQEESPKGFFNLYGSADAALMGFETELSVALRRKISSLNGLNNSIFADDRLPSLYQYDPRLTYFQAFDRELHITKYYGVPLVKYNIQDQGGLVTYSQMKEISELQETFSMATKEAELPFVYLFGREKFMIKLYGANIYTEHVQQALNHFTIQSEISGRFVMECEYDQEQNPKLVCHIELSPKKESHESLREKVHDVFVEEVQKVNSEYRFLISELGDKVKPLIKLYPHGHKKHFSKGKVKKTS